MEIGIRKLNTEINLSEKIKKKYKGDIRSFRYCVVEMIDIDNMEQKIIFKKGGITMKRKVISVLLATTMLASLLAGCGGSSSSTSAKVSSDGKVFNIYCWNTEFQDRVKMHFPGYEEVDGTTGKIGILQ